MEWLEGMDERRKVTVYVDDMKAAYRGMIMCHMMADSTDELVAMATRIGVNSKWIQKPGTAYEHFDISLGKRKLAVSAGAVEVTRKELVRKMILRRKQRA